MLKIMITEDHLRRARHEFKHDVRGLACTCLIVQIMKENGFTNPIVGLGSATGHKNFIVHEFDLDAVAKRVVQLRPDQWHSCVGKTVILTERIRT